MKDLVFVKLLCKNIKGRVAYQGVTFIKYRITHKLHGRDVLNTICCSLDLRIQSRPRLPALLRLVVPKASFNPKVYPKIGNLKKFKISYETDRRFCKLITAEELEISSKPVQKLRHKTTL